MRRVLSRGYHVADLRADALSGVLVGVVALPLSMALAIAVGVPPQHGLYTAIIAGFSVALLGGSKFQVTGPTAAFVVILAPITNRYGLSGLLTAGMIAGVMLTGMGLARFGALVRFMPYPVTTGFTTGIATVIATLQVKDVFGLTPAGAMPDHYLERVVTLFRARGTARWEEVVVSVATFALIVYLPKVVPKLPSPLLAISFVAAACALAHRLDPRFVVATIGSRFTTVVDGVAVHGIPGVLPRVQLPWGTSGLSFADVRELASAAFAIAMLGAIESLLSATIADGMTNTQHDPNAELVALGIGNVVAPFFGGIPATGALARTATNIRAGARSPVSAIIHALLVLLSILVFAPLVAYVPMASLAALLVRVAWNMSEVHNFVGILEVAPKSDTAVLLLCYFLTVVFDMVVAISVGMVLAVFLFMRRMATLTESRLRMDSMVEEGQETAIPEGVVLYEINGPLFFGAAQSAMSALHASRADGFRVLVLDLGRVPVIDATGLAALENAISSVTRRRKTVVIAGPLPRPHQIFDKADLPRKYPGLSFEPSVEDALRLAGRLATTARVA
ncbi:MAG TPA: C4-dicarboxylic acid transporter DauA [Polyangiaceae bacterium]|nr:C4-dicarboxylic acid transporter DauA [Polyangiaceae bacterium]